MFPPEARLEFGIASRGCSGLDSWETFRQKVHNCSLFCRTASVRRGAAAPRQLPRSEKPLDLQQLIVGGDTNRTAEQCLVDGHSEAIVVVHKGVVLVEKYFNDTQPWTKSLMCSVSKSLVGIVLANLVDEGLLTYDTKVIDVLPELQGTVWDEVTIRQATLQASGVKASMGVEPGDAFYEDLQATALESTPEGKQPPLLYDSVRKATDLLFPPGTYFEYNEANAHVVAWACQRLTNTMWHDLVSKYVWQKIGAAEDSFFVVDTAGIADDAAGFNCTLMDLTRYALALMHNDAPDTPADKRLCPPGYFTNILTEGATSPAVAAAHDPNNILNSDFMDELLGYAHYCLLVRYGSHRAVLTSGLLGQVAVMQPEMDLVIARVGSSLSLEDSAHCRVAYTVILDYIAGLESKDE